MPTWLSKKVILCFVLGIVFILFVSYHVYFENVTNTDVVVEDEFFQEIKEEEVESISVTVDMMVDVKGEVKHQGVYELQEGARVQDAIKMAGGFTDKADSLQVNLAELIYDEMVIYVPKVGDEIVTPISKDDKNGKIQINRATIEELQTLTGIGPSKAAAIKAYIEENGPLKNIEDLLNVTGIGEKTLEKIKEQISVNP